MKISSVLVATALFALSAVAQAHTHLKQATPADKSVVNTAPASVMLKFSEAAKVTALTLHKDGEADQKLTASPDTASAQVTAALPKLSPGKYSVNWRVVSDDGHIMSGQLSFTFDPKATPSAGAAPAHEHH
ncbi:MAG: copper resistance CopC family protein [Gammaproteobacteria bacterium]